MNKKWKVYFIEGVLPRACRFVFDGIKFSSDCYKSDIPTDLIESLVGACQIAFDPSFFSAALFGYSLLKWLWIFYSEKKKADSKKR